MIPNLNNSINRIDTLNNCLDQINKTSTTDSKHKACVCVICDCFIIGIEPICWLSEDDLKSKDAVLSTSYLEKHSEKKLPGSLQNQYKIEGNENLSNLLLSPRAAVKNGMYMSCETCHQSIKRAVLEKPPKFAISNGWCIGQLPTDLIDGEIDDILASAVACIRIFANVYSYSAGAYKAIKGHHVFFSMILNMLEIHLST